MDIRNFFGNNKGAPKPTSSKSKSPETKENKNKQNEPVKKVEEKAPETSTDSSSNELIIGELSSGSESISPEALKIIKWEVGQPIPFAAVVDTFEEISKNSSRIEKENLICNLFQAVIATTPSDLEVVVYLISNQVFPVYAGMELGIGDSVLVKAVCEATGRKKEAVEEAYEKEGDLGTVAAISRASQKTLSFAAKPKPMTARHVLEQYRAITQIKGDKAQSRKVAVIKGLMVKCQSGGTGGTDNEAKYIIRALQGKLRIGTAGATVLVGLAHAFATSRAPLAGLREIIEGAAEQEKEDLENSSLDGENSTIEKENSTVEQVKSVVEKEKTTIEKEEKGDTPMVMEEAGEDKSLAELMEHVREPDPPEAVHLRRLMFSLASSKKSGSKKSEVFANFQQYAEVAVKRAFSECPDLSKLTQALLSHPLYDLHKQCRLTLGTPVAPMLAKPTKEVNEVLKRLSGQAFTMEYKYDGERAQVHLFEDGTVKIFSRNSEDNSEKYPEFRDIVRQAKTAGLKSCIVDAEVVAYDREKGVLLPFQILSTRKRKVEEIDKDTQKVKVILQAFDLLHLNGRSLLRESLRTRRTLLFKAFNKTEGLLHFASGADHLENGDTLPIEAFLQEACAAQCEGLMVKTLDQDASYEPSKRSLNWLKLKKDYIDGMGVCDSVDLVPIGGYFGRGKRANVYGAYLMACYDPERDEYQSVCKVGTGFTDEDLSKLHEEMKNHVLNTSRRPINYQVGDSLESDIHWFKTATVWELQAADLSLSSVHKGGLGRVTGANGRGVGLRFPRFLRARTDKGPEHATSAEQIVDMYYSQQGTGDSGGNQEDDDDDGI